MESKLYMCYVQGSRGTTRTHSDKEIAETEAKRLSALEHNQGKSVFVLEATEQYQSNEEVK